MEKQHLRSEWKDRRVLVTGGTGFLGRHLVRRLAEKGAQVTVALEEGVRPAGDAVLPGAVDWRDGDVRHYGLLRRLVETVAPEFVLHLAAVGVNDVFINAEIAVRVNVVGTLNLLRAVQTVGGVRRLVVAGTSHEYGEKGQLDPGNVYAASKVAAWAFCRTYYRAHGTPVVVARPFNVYGPGQDARALVAAAVQAALADQDLPTTPGEQRRDFVYIDDVVAGFMALALAEGIEGQSLDLGTGVGTPVRHVVERIFALAGSKGHPQIGALPYRPGLVREQVADAERTARFTGWRAAVPLEEGLQATLAAQRT